MNNLQLDFAAGIPSLTLLINLVTGIYYSNPTRRPQEPTFPSLRNGMTGLENWMDVRTSVIES